MWPAARSSSAAAAVLVTFALAGCGGGGAGGNAGSAQPIEVAFEPQGEFGQSGSATINSVGDGQVNIVVEVVSAVTELEVQPAHIHEGTCADTDAAVAYELFDVVQGIGAGTVDVDIDTLTASPHFVDVHKSAEMDTVVSCGEITR